MEIFPSGVILFPALFFLLFERTSLLCVLAEWRRYMGSFLLQSFVSRHNITPKVYQTLGVMFVWFALSSQMG